MKLLQHIYGRVSRGVQPGAAGYQLAAVSPELAARPGVVPCLNRQSFYRHRAAGGTGPARWSFFHPGPGLLAFGQVRMTTDLTGAAASFAHHFVAQDKEFFRTGWTPTQILHALPFLTGERDLPDDRNLPAYDLPDHAPDPPPGELREPALALLDRVLGEDRLRVPMLIAGDLELWPLLEELYRLLPRAESAQLTFSTLFGQCGEFLDSFRLVSVPDAAQAQRMPDVFEPLVPADLQPMGTAHPLGTFWRSYPARGVALRRLVDSLRHGVPSDGATHLRPLLETGAPFRAAVEGLGVPAVYALLLDDVNDLTAFAKSGPALSLASLREAMWQRPMPRLAVVLAFARATGASSLRDDVLADVGRQLADGADPGCFAVIEQSGQIADFYRVCAARLELGEVMPLAERLRECRGYAGELHHVVVRRLLERHGADKSSWAWVRRQQSAAPLARAAVAFFDAINDRPPSLPEMETFALPAEDVALLTRWAWQEAGRAGLNDGARIRALFTPVGREAFFRLLTERLAELGPEEAAARLAAVVTHRHFTSSDESRVLGVTTLTVAGHLLGRLQEARRGSSELHEGLAELAKRSRRDGWLSWLRG